MPHCIVEYSKNLEIQVEATELLKAVQTGALNSGLFDPQAIKVRAIAYEYVQMGDLDDGQFVHVMARILSGRSEALKTKLSKAVYLQLQNLNLSLDSLTVEICDIDRISHQPCPD